jgi:hypothetical protein
LLTEAADQVRDSAGAYRHRESPVSVSVAGPEGLPDPAGRRRGLTSSFFYLVGGLDPELGTPAGAPRAGSTWSEVITFWLPWVS